MSRLCSALLRVWLLQLGYVRSLSSSGSSMHTTPWGGKAGVPPRNISTNPSAAPYAARLTCTHAHTYTRRYEVLEMDPGKRLVLSGLSEHHTQVCALITRQKVYSPGCC